MPRLQLVRTIWGSPFGASFGYSSRSPFLADPPSISVIISALSTSGTKLVFLGPPGVGKGTFAGRIAKRLGIPTVSTGDIIRGEIKAGSSLGKQVQAFSDAGKLVPDEIVTAMVKKRLSQPDAKAGFILVRSARCHRCAARPRIAASDQQQISLCSSSSSSLRFQDGYPRTVQQAADLDAFQVCDAASHFLCACFCIRNNNPAVCGMHHTAENMFIHTMHAKLCTSAMYLASTPAMFERPLPQCRAEC